MVVVVALGVKDVQRLGLLYNENCWTVWKNHHCKSSIRVVSKVTFICSIAFVFYLCHVPPHWSGPLDYVLCLLFHPISFL